jgi:hypothetical protein
MPETLTIKKLFGSPTTTVTNPNYIVYLISKEGSSERFGIDKTAITPESLQTMLLWIHQRVHGKKPHGNSNPYIIFTHVPSQYQAMKAYRGDGIGKQRYHNPMRDY